MYLGITWQGFSTSHHKNGWTILNTFDTNEKEENLNEETEDINKNEKEILELKNTRNKRQISVDAFNIKMKEREERISELEDREIDIPQSE